MEVLVFVALLGVGLAVMRMHGPFQISLRSLLVITFLFALALGGVKSRLDQLASQREAIEAISQHYGQLLCERNEDGWTRFFFGEFPYAGRVVLKLYGPTQRHYVVHPSDETVTEWIEYQEATAPQELSALVKRLPRLDEVRLSDRTPPETIAAIREAFPRCSVRTEADPPKQPNGRVDRRRVVPTLEL
jgi:hypothetical protein